MNTLKTPQHTSHDVQYSHENQSFLLKFQSVDLSEITVSLPPSQFRKLITKCLGLTQDIVPVNTTINTGGASKTPLQILSNCSDNAIRVLLSTIDNETVIDALWYINDGQFIKKILNNLSEPAGAMLLENLNLKWREKNPDNASEDQVKTGRNSVEKIMKKFAGLMFRGCIEVYAGEKSLLTMSGESFEFIDEKAPSRFAISTSETKQDDNKYMNLSSHVSWLLCLKALFTKVKSRGYYAIENDICLSDREGSIFRQFPHVMQKPYLEFATDILRLIVDGFQSPDDLEIYVKHAISGLTKPKLLNRVDKSLFLTIWLPIWCMLKGMSLHIALEFGRQAIPASMKPSRDELYGLLYKKKVTDSSFDAEVDSYIESMGIPTENELHDVDIDELISGIVNAKGLK